MVNVLVFGMTDNPGGVESVIMNYYRNIIDPDIHFDFLCNYHSMVYYDEVIARGSKVFFITPRRENYRQFVYELDQFMRKNAKKYQAIWVNLCSLVNIDYLISAKKYGIPKRIIHCHNSDNDAGRLKWIIHQFNRLRVTRYATHFWSCSDTASNWFYNKDTINSPKYRVITNAIDVNRFTFDASLRSIIRKDLGVENKIVIGHVGRFHFQKNHKYLIKIFSKLCKINDSFHLLLVGKGELEDSIRAIVKAENLEKKVSFVGATLKPESYYQAMDIFVLPSVFEGLGVVALEAQANGLPCILSTAVPNIVKINENVEFIQLKPNVKEWTDCILKNSNSKRNGNSHMQGSLFDIRYQIKIMEKILKEQ